MLLYLLQIIWSWTASGPCKNYNKCGAASMLPIAGLQTCNCATHLERIFLRWFNDHQALQSSRIPWERIMICAVGTCKIIFSLGQREKAFPRLLSSTCWQVATGGGLHQLKHPLRIVDKTTSDIFWLDVQISLIYFRVCVSAPFPPFFTLFVTPPLFRVCK